MAGPAGQSKRYAEEVEHKDPKKAKREEVICVDDDEPAADPPATAQPSDTVGAPTALGFVKASGVEPAVPDEEAMASAKEPADPVEEEEILCTIPTMTPVVNGQKLTKIGEGESYEIAQSPYGKERNKLYGWGTVFQQIPAVTKNKKIHIGTSSLYAVPTQKKSDASALFPIYGRKFMTLEHCATFYRVNDDATWLKWKGLATSISKDFRMTVKANKYLTHDKQLRLDDEVRGHIAEFTRKACLLGDTLGAVLIQLPPSFRKSDETLSALDTLGSVLPSTMRFAFEFRSPTMFCDEVYGIMQRNNWTMVLYHLREGSRDFTTPIVETSSDLVYIRLHGAVTQFVGDYGEEVMSRWASIVSHLAAKGKEVYIFLNNNESFVQKVNSSVVDATCLAKLIDKSAKKDGSK